MLTFPKASKPDASDRDGLSSEGVHDLIDLNRSLLSELSSLQATSRLLTLKGDLQLATARDFMPPAG